MAAKRTATTDLNHTNWNEAEKPEEKGEFQTAPETELQGRVIKKAKRTLENTEEGSVKSIFSSFKGFSQTAALTTATSTSTPFAFLRNLSSAPSLTQDSMQETETSTKDKFQFEKSSTYYAKLKGLNLAVFCWIKKHVDENPLCILTPIFTDYEKYLKEMQEEHSSETETPNGNENLLSREEQNTEEPNAFAFESPKSTYNFPVKQKSEGESEEPRADSVKFTPPKALFSFTTFKSSNTAPTDLSFVQKTEANSSTNNPIFSFRESTSSAQNPATTSTAGFSFSNSTNSFTFGSVNKPKDTETPKETDDVDEPPKADFKPVVEEDSVYSKTCKVFVKHGPGYADKGVGTLHLKPVKDSDKMQLLVRADTSLGNILLNLILNNSIPTQRMGRNNVMMVCIPTPESEQKPRPILLRVKTTEEADELLETLNKYKK